MPVTRIIVANQCAYPKGYIIAVRDNSEERSINETMKNWLDAGYPANEWKRHFSSVIVTDKTPEELQYLLSPHILYAGIEPIDDGRKYSFIEPEQTSSFYAHLFNVGEVEVLFAEMLPYLIERL